MKYEMYYIVRVSKTVGDHIWCYDFQEEAEDQYEICGYKAEKVELLRATVLKEKKGEKE